MTWGFNTLALLAAIILFILAIFLDQHQFDLLLAGLAAFAASHMPGTQQA